jgi:hypothetical protein
MDSLNKYCAHWPHVNLSHSYSENPETLYTIEVQPSLCKRQARIPVSRALYSEVEFRDHGKKYQLDELLIIRREIECHLN